ncbi:MAG: alpha/beta hydrolase [Alphaproteobacteria bacterium]|nr:alpha/beta hydrolase [Alphaproteobacteria bacterium]
MALPLEWQETLVTAGGVKVCLRQAGKGRPLLILHHDTGSPARLPFYDSLAAHFDVLLPHHPGYGADYERPTWMRNVRDLAVLYRGILAGRGVQRPILVGLGFGGWIAAEMATMAPDDLDRLVLVGAMGIHPAEGYILDQAIVSHIDYARAAFHDQAAFDAVYGAEPSTDQLVDWDFCREMNFRIAWKPYMYSQTLPHLLGAVKAPALLVWGDDDKVVPLAAAERYKAALPNARLELVKACGHAIDMEKPAELVRLITTFADAR